MIMGYQRILYGACLLGLVVLISCSGDGSRKLPADIVSNPNSASGKSEDGLPMIAFEKDVHDFGKVIQGEKVSFGFKFKNTGKADLIIAQVNTSCGCTVPKFPKTPIKPGEENVITVMFDSQDRKGVQNKTITVVSNCQPSNTVIRIKAMVIVP
jgi:hypothetical protein